MKRGKPSISHAAALACTFVAYKRHGRLRFTPEPADIAPLKQAQALGWVWFPTPATCCVTADGCKALEPYGVGAGV